MIFCASLNFRKNRHFVIRVFLISRRRLVVFDGQCKCNWTYADAIFFASFYFREFERKLNTREIFLTYCILQRLTVLLEYMNKWNKMFNVVNIYLKINYRQSLNVFDNIYALVMLKTNKLGYRLCRYFLWYLVLFKWSLLSGYVHLLSVLIHALTEVS